MAQFRLVRNEEIFSGRKKLPHPYKCWTTNVFVLNDENKEACASQNIL